MAKIRSHVVSRASCAVVARELGLGERLAERGAERAGEELERLAENRNVLAAVLEAALAALFLEHGFEPIEAAIVEAFAERIEYALTTTSTTRPSSRRRSPAAAAQVSYAVLEVDGPPHDRRFTCAAVIDGEQAGLGTGSSKKAAEQEAAREALAGSGIAEGVTRQRRCRLAPRRAARRSRARRAEELRASSGTSSRSTRADRAAARDATCSTAAGVAPSARRCQTPAGAPAVRSSCAASSRSPTRSRSGSSRASRSSSGRTARASRTSPTRSSGRPAR